MTSTNCTELSASPCLQVQCLNSLNNRLDEIIQTLNDQLDIENNSLSTPPSNFPTSSPPVIPTTELQEANLLQLSMTVTLTNITTFDSLQQLDMGGTLRSLLASSVGLNASLIFSGSTTLPSPLTRIETNAVNNRRRVQETLTEQPTLFLLFSAGLNRSALEDLQSDSRYSQFSDSVSLFRSIWTTLSAYVEKGYLNSDLEKEGIPGNFTSLQLDATIQSAVFSAQRRSNPLFGRSTAELLWVGWIILITVVGVYICFWAGHVFRGWIRTRDAEEYTERLFRQVETKPTNPSEPPYTCWKILYQYFSSCVGVLLFPNFPPIPPRILNLLNCKTLRKIKKWIKKGLYEIYKQIPTIFIEFIQFVLGVLFDAYQV